MNRLFVAFELLCVLLALCLAVYWYMYPSKNLEPLIVFFMVIPVAIEVIRRFRKNKKLLKVIPNEYDKDKKIVLIVEDDKYILEDLITLFNYEGINAIGASSAKDAITIYKRQ